MKWCLFSFLFSIFFLSAELPVRFKERFVLQGGQTGLNRPEGLSFSPDQTAIAVCNSLSNEVSLYKKVEGSFATFEKEPYCTITGDESQLAFPHDVSFSPDGQDLLVANRFGHYLTVYRKNNDGIFDCKPIQTIQAKNGTLNGVGGVAYCPKRPYIASVNSYDNSLSFSYYNDEHYAPFVALTIHSEIMDIPDGLSFTEDGLLLFVSCYRSNVVLVFDMDQIDQLLQDGQEHAQVVPSQVIAADALKLTFPHSSAIHPTDNFIALTGSGGFTVAIVERDAECLYGAPFYEIDFASNRLREIQKDEPDGCGAKGVAFSPDGKILAVAIPERGGEDKIRFYEVIDKESSSYWNWLSNKIFAKTS